MSYRNKVYVAFDADSDINYYRLMQAWKQNDNTDFDFNNVHEINNLLQGSSEETIKAKLRERMNNSKIFILLVGENTRYLYKYVKWEIEQAIKHELPIIVSNLNGKRSMDSEKCPPVLREELAIHVSFNAKIIQYALENWGDSHTNYVSQGKTGPYYYKDSVYQDLGLL